MQVSCKDMGGKCEDTIFDSISELEKAAGFVGTNYKCPICEKKLDVPKAFKD